MYPFDNNDERRDDPVTPVTPAEPAAPAEEPAAPVAPAEPAVPVEEPAAPDAPVMPEISAFPEMPIESVMQAIGEGEEPPAEAPDESPAPVPDTAPAPVVPPANPPYGGQNTGWYQPGAMPPTPPPAPPVTPPSPSNPYQYTTGRAYDPYGWQRNPTSIPFPQPPPPKKRKASSVLLAILACVCVVTLVALSVMVVLAIRQGGDLIVDKPSSSNTEVVNPNAPTLEITDPDKEADILNTQSIIQKNLDCTVVITTYEQAMSYDSFPFGGTTGGGQDAGLVEASNATGIVMSEDGYIITNRHCVVNEQTNIQYAQIDVKTYNGKVYEKAEVIGVDSDTDLAVIKVKATDLTKAEFGDSSKLALGDKVVALGNSGGLEWTPTQGIISGLARDVYDDTGYSIKCLQTDAAINPGNSGGPLINASGQVIGINSAKIVASGYESLGFSIPINEAKPIIESLLKYGYVKGRVSLGITGSTYTSTNSNYNGFQIHSINKESSLNATAAESGDIITHVNDVRVTDYATLRAQLSTYNVGDTVTLTLLHINLQSRRMETITVTCTLQESTGG